MRTRSSRLTYLLLEDWTWWAWLAIALLLTLGLSGYEGAFATALALSILQFGLIWMRERSVQAFPFQLRLAYTILLFICFIPGMKWLFWLPTIGTFALVIFGYCLMARLLSLLPWNRDEPISIDLLKRTFFTRPALPVNLPPRGSFACAGGMCTIQAQVPRAHK